METEEVTAEVTTEPPTQLKEPTSSTGVQEQRTSSTGVQEQRTSSTGVQEQRTSSTGVQEQRTSSTGVQEQRASSTGVQEQRTESNDIKAATEVEGESSKLTDSSACDWLEPLEEDCEDADAESFDQDGTGDAELESLAGSEWSGKNGGERGSRGVQRRRKTNFDANEDWEDCLVLGEGWKRRQVFRRSGTSEGRSDTYYMSPSGLKLRSRVELLKHVDQSLDLSKFDFKSGMLLNDVKRRRVRRSSPYLTQRNGDNRTVSPHGSSPCHTDATLTTPVSAGPAAPPLTDPVCRTSDVLLNGKSDASIGNCERCNNSFTVDQEQTVCEKCRKEFNTHTDTSRRPYRKWAPCGRCRACQITADCGKCFGCRNERIRVHLNVQSRKVIKCRKRKCLYPVRKDKIVKVNPLMSNPVSLDTGSLNTHLSYSKPSVSDFEESQSSFLQCSDSEDLSVFFVNDGDGCMDEISAGKLRRRSCGTCKGCIRRTDCGSCDFCMDKPKFGGMNKKRQKCRLRQCQREAMKHLLPMDESQDEVSVPQGWVYGGRRRARGRRRSRTLWGFNASYNEAEHYRRSKAQMINRNSLFHDYNGKSFSHFLNSIPLYSPHDIKRSDIQLKVLPTARCEGSTFLPSYVKENFREERKSQSSAYQHESRSSPSMFSVADGATAGIDPQHELMPLFKSLGSVVLPVLWFCIVVEGPRLQLLQCSKRSPMADTSVIIEPSFQYHVSVQGQPLLPTHRLYDTHPARLTTAADVVGLLADLEKHSVCQGSDNKEPPAGPEPVFPERAATCDFLISPESERCAKCSTEQTSEA